MRPSDNLVVANAWSIEKEEYLPYNMKKDYIQDMCKSQCAALGDRYEWIHRELEPGHIAKEVLV